MITIQSSKARAVSPDDAEHMLATSLARAPNISLPTFFFFCSLVGAYLGFPLLESNAVRVAVYVSVAVRGATVG